MSVTQTALCSPVTTSVSGSATFTLFPPLPTLPDSPLCVRVISPAVAVVVVSVCVCVCPPVCVVVAVRSAADTFVGD